MGMVLGLAEVTDANRQRIVADPPLIWQLIAPDDPDAYREARQRQDAGGLLGRLFKRAGSSAVPDLDLADGEGLDTDLDKAWHGLHFLLTGTSDGGTFPAGFLLLGGEEIDEDVGYGPAQAFSAAQTRQIAAHLAALDDSELAARFDPAKMMALNIYPEIWDRPAVEEDTLGYLMENLNLLRRVVTQASAAGRGLIVTMS